MRLIFTVTSGRSGTAYLASMLECVPGVLSLHEPQPNFVQVMRQVQSDPAAARRFWVERKLPAIEETCATVYSEASHLVCKGFLEPLIDLGYRPDLILLRRPDRDVALSLYRHGSVPGRTSKAMKWYLSPADPGVLELPGWETLHDYQLCYWYCLETERRRQYYGEMLARLGARVVAITLAELVTLRGFLRLRKELALPGVLVGPHHWMRYARRFRVRHNRKLATLQPVETPERIDELEAHVRKLVATGRLTKQLT